MLGIGKTVGNGLVRVRRWYTPLKRCVNKRGIWPEGRIRNFSNRLSAIGMFWKRVFFAGAVGPGFFGIAWAQFDPEAAALARGGYHTGPAAHSFDRFADDGEANASALFGVPRLLEYAENPLL